MAAEAAPASEGAPQPLRDPRVRQPVLGLDPVILDRTDLDSLSKTKSPDLLEQLFQLLHPVQMPFQGGDLVGLLVTQIKLSLQDEVRPDVDGEGIGPSLVYNRPRSLRIVSGRARWRACNSPASAATWSAGIGTGGRGGSGGAGANETIVRSRPRKEAGDFPLGSMSLSVLLDGGIAEPRLRRRQPFQQYSNWAAVAHSSPPVPQSVPAVPDRRDTCR